MRWIIIALLAISANAQDSNATLHLVSLVPVYSSEELKLPNKSGEIKIYVSKQTFLSKDDIESAQYSLTSIPCLTIKLKEGCRARIVNMLANTPHEGLIKKQDNKYILEQSPPVNYGYESNII